MMVIFRKGIIITIKEKEIRNLVGVSIGAGVRLGCHANTTIVALLRNVGNSDMELMSVDSGTVKLTPTKLKERMQTSKG